MILKLNYRKITVYNTDVSNCFTYCNIVLIGWYIIRRDCSMHARNLIVKNYKLVFFYTNDIQNI